jgi:predicted RNA binding protein YcfA (HicA-like mRNA interferase family)
MKWSELRRIAEKKGWQLYRHGANHDVYRHPDKPEKGLLIGRHGKEEVPTGTYQRVKRLMDL